MTYLQFFLEKIKIATVAPILSLLFNFLTPLVLILFCAKLCHLGQSLFQALKGILGSKMKFTPLTENTERKKMSHTKVLKSFSNSRKSIFYSSKLPHVHRMTAILFYCRSAVDWKPGCNISSYRKQTLKHVFQAKYS